MSEDRRAVATTRDVDFSFALERDGEGGDGLSFSGYAAVFNSPTEIRDQDGEYTEVISPGAFKRSIRAKTPVLMFDHGKHPMIGNIPIGKITDIREDPRGVYVRARLIDNPTISIVRDAIAAEAITGMSFRFEVVKDEWSPASRGGKRTRTLKEVRVPEVGPVVFPAYADTTASVRSTVRALEEKFPEVMHVQIGATRDDELSTQDSTVSDLVSDAVETLWGLDDNTSDVYVIDLFDTHAIFTVQGNGKEKYGGLWQVDYTYTNGLVSISEPHRPALAGYATSTNSQEQDGEDRAYSADQRKTMASNGQAMPDGSYPIANKADLQNAIHAVGRGSGSHDAIRKHIIKRAKALGAADMIPPGWSADGSMMQMNSQELGTSEELATDEGTSEELADRADRPISRDQMIRLIALEERGIVIPKETLNA